MPAKIIADFNVLKRTEHVFNISTIRQQIFSKEQSCEDIIEYTHLAPTYKAIIQCLGRPRYLRGESHH